MCGPNADIKELIDYEEFCGVPGHHADDTSAGADWDITARGFKARLERDPKLILLDVREPHELEIAAIQGAKNIPAR